MASSREENVSADPQDAFKEQLLAIIPALRAFARGLCGNRDLADDLVQEAMVRAWAAQQSYTMGTNFRAWMFMIVRNQFYTTMRKNSRISAWDPEAAERLLVAEPTQHLGLELADVAHALSKLPVQQREMLMLVSAGGMSYEDAASVTGVAIGTVKSRIARGRAALLQMIEGEAQNAPVDAIKALSGRTTRNLREGDAG
jgi:RNA polymerase sigma-70 factor, ECF subfamily